MPRVAITATQRPQKSALCVHLQHDNLLSIAGGDGSHSADDLLKGERRMLKTISMIGSASGALTRRATLGLMVTASVLVMGQVRAEAAKDSVTIGMAVEPGGLDPTIGAQVMIGQVTWQNVFEGLTTIDREGKVVFYCFEAILPSFDLKLQGR